MIREKTPVWQTCDSAPFTHLSPSRLPDAAVMVAMPQQLQALCQLSVCMATCSHQHYMTELLDSKAELGFSKAPVPQNTVAKA